MEHKIIDRIIPEPSGGAHRNHKEAADNLKEAILEELKAVEKQTLINFRSANKKYSAMGYWEG
jgi:acetyl-CoA carboxylase carboxyl transferase subunit alpha